MPKVKNKKHKHKEPRNSSEFLKKPAEISKPSTSKDTTSEMLNTKKRKKEEASVTSSADDDTASNISVATSNRFEPLDEDIQIEPDADVDHVSKKLPPIIMHKHPDNPKVFFKIIKENCTDLVNIKCTSKSTIFTTKNLKDYHEVIRILKLNDTPFHSYQLPGQSLVKLVLKGLSNGFTDLDIKEELENMGFKVIKVIQLKNKIKNIYIPKFICMFSPDTSTKEILKIKNLLYTCISWEKYRNNRSYIQCLRCLSFGHVSTFCSSEERCLKCSGAHRNSECNTDTVSCANCLGAHWANSPECPKLQMAIHLRAANKNKNTPKQDSNIETILKKSDFPKMSSRYGDVFPEKEIIPSNVGSDRAQYSKIANQEKKPKLNLIEETLALINKVDFKSIFDKLILLLHSLVKAKNTTEFINILLEKGIPIFINGSHNKT